MKQYSLEHLWIEEEKKSFFKVGLTQKFLDSLDEIVHIEFPLENQKIQKGDVFCILETNKAALEIEAICSGIIGTINEGLHKDISLLKKDPENKGWICKIQIADLKETKTLLSREDYLKYYS